MGGYAGATRGFQYQDGAYSLIDAPGATVTLPTGINDAGDIVGYYSNASNVTNGFLYRQGVFTDISVPGAARTNVLGVNNRGDVVGDFTQTPDGPEQPFVKIGDFYSRLDLSTLTFPGQAIVTDATGINDFGTLVGYRGGDDGSVVSFIGTPNAAAPSDLLLLGGSASAPQALPLSLVGSISGAIGGPGGLTSEFYSFNWLGGAFGSEVSVLGAASGTYYDFKLCSGGVCGSTLASTILDHGNGWSGAIDLSDLAAGRYTIGLIENQGGPDPLFTIRFRSAVGSAVPEPASWTLMLSGFASLGALLRHRRRHAATPAA